MSLKIQENGKFLSQIGSENMIIIGKTREVYEDDNLPSIKDLICSKPIKESKKVLEHLKNGKKGAVASGYAVDVISKERIAGELCCFSDGKFGWRSDTIYYFEKYNLKLDDEFINYVLNGAED